MGFSNFYRFLGDHWTSAVSGNSVPQSVQNVATCVPELFDLIQVSNETSDANFVFTANTTMAAGSAYLNQIKGTDLRFFPYLSGTSGNRYLKISFFKGLSLLGTAACNFYTDYSYYKIYGRVISEDTAILQFVADTASRHGGTDCIVIAKGTLADGSQKMFILAGANGNNTVTWACEDGTGGTITVPVGIVDSTLGEYIALNNLVIPNKAAFANVYLTMYRTDSNSQLVSTEHGVFATAAGASGYAQFYVKCPEVSQ